MALAITLLALVPIPEGRLVLISIPAYALIGNPAVFIWFIVPAVPARVRRAGAARR